MSEHRGEEDDEAEVEAPIELPLLVEQDDAEEERVDRLEVDRELRRERAQSCFKRDQREREGDQMVQAVAKMNKRTASRASGKRQAPRRS